MQKAYCYFSTLPSKGLQTEEGEAVRSRWADLINEIANKHTKLA